MTLSSANSCCPARALDPRRLAEIRSVAETLAKSAQGALAWSSNVCLLGDFCARLPDMLLAAPLPTGMIAAMLTGFDLPLARRVRSALSAVPPHVVAGRIRMVLGVDARTSLRAFAKPLLLLGAGRDRLVGPAYLAGMAALAPHAHVVTLDAPHLVLQTAPKEALAALAAG